MENQGILPLEFQTVKKPHTLERIGKECLNVKYEKVYDIIYKSVLDNMNIIHPLTSANYI